MKPLCNNEEKTRPATRQTTKAVMPAGEICRPKRFRTGWKNQTEFPDSADFEPDANNTPRKQVNVGQPEELIVEG